MNADYLQLSDRRCRIRVGKTTFYVKTVEPPQDGWPTGEAQKGTYDVDDGTETRRVEAWNAAEAVQPSAPAFASVVPPVRSYAYNVPTPGQPATTKWSDPRIVKVQSGTNTLTGQSGYFFSFDDGTGPRGQYTVFSTNEADAVAQYDGRNTP